MAQAVIFEGASVVLPDRMASVSVRIEAGRITGIDAPRDGAAVIDARDMILAPAFVDAHGDAFERQLMPRPGVLVPVDAALLETDRQLAANGIATAYHALTLSWEPGLRSVDTAWAVLRALQTLAPRLTVEHRLQLRWETFCPEAIPLIEQALAGPLTPSIAFNDHTSMAVLHPGTPLQDRPFDLVPDYPVTDLDSPAFAAKMTDRAKRARMDLPEFITLMKAVWARRAEVPAGIERVAAMGRETGAAMASHDDSQVETRAFYRAAGARLSEFPMNRRVAEFARSGGDSIVLGAPNAARGGSHLGSIGAGQMVRDGLCDILASDYHYPALLAAMARLAADGLGPLPRLWPLVAESPARALGLQDRGRIAIGQSADLILLDWPMEGPPVVRQTWVKGQCAYRAAP